MLRILPLADLEGIERLLSGQSGVALGLLLGSGLSFFGARIFIAAFISKIEDVLDRQDRSIAATDRLCRTVANALIESRLKVFQDRGREIIEELNMDAQNSKNSKNSKP